MAKMPRVDYVPGTEKGVINVQLTKPTTINTGNPSAFPMAADVFKNLNYQTAQQSELNTQMKEYYEILARIMGGNTKSGDMQQLENLTGQIREFVLTDDDYNLVIGALQNMQTYVISFMYGDITRKAQAMDVELNKVITEIDRFMMNNSDKLKKLGLYVENPQETIGWCHVQFRKASTVFFNP